MILRSNVFSLWVHLGSNHLRVTRKQPALYTPPPFSFIPPSSSLQNPHSSPFFRSPRLTSSIGSLPHDSRAHDSPKPSASLLFHLLLRFTVSLILKRFRVSFFRCRITSLPIFSLFSVSYPAAARKSDNLSLHDTRGSFFLA